MKLNINVGHAGVMTLKDGMRMNYGVIRIAQNMSKLVFYTGTGLREIFKPNMTDAEKQRAAELKRLHENTLMRMGYISEIPLADIQSLN